ncbi:hypothetical protein T484DRAFT_1817911 [Baffinella frigidus]|nr:hypothetical protein T484DRAFT_1817911 [Cryptophyta sp. CCMP2293]
MGAIPGRNKVLEAALVLKGLLARIEAGKSRGAPLDPPPRFLSPAHLLRLLAWAPNDARPDVDASSVQTDASSGRGGRTGDAGSVHKKALGKGSRPGADEGKGTRSVKKEKVDLSRELIEAVLLTPPEWLQEQAPGAPALYAIASWLLAGCWPQDEPSHTSARDPRTAGEAAEGGGVLLARAVWWIAAAVGTDRSFRQATWARSTEPRSLFRALLFLLQRPPSAAPVLRPANCSAPPTYAP